MIDKFVTANLRDKDFSADLTIRFIPAEYRPHIWVKVLPALENIFYGGNLSNILSAHQYVILDVLAWFPYGILHFGGPFVWAGLMFLFGPPGTLPVFARTFGYLNIVGVAIQLIFPCSPPWYENMYGLAPANYSMAGSPAGLARIDLLFGFDMYTSNFTASPLVFGAFPSLHSGNAVLEALFMSHCFPKLITMLLIWLRVDSLRQSLSTSHRRTSCQEFRWTRRSAGTMITLRLEMIPAKATNMGLQSLMGMISATTAATSGPLAPRHQFPQDREARLMRANLGKARHSQAKLQIPNLAT